MTREENLAKLREARANLEAAVARLSDEQMLEPCTCGEWSVKDELAHVVFWEQHLLADAARVRRGETVHEVQDAEVNAINAANWERNKDKPLDQARKDFQTSYSQVVAWLEGASEEELAKPYAYGMTLGEFVKIDTGRTTPSTRR